MADKKIRTRFAPSPTGFLHIGSLRTALYAYALAKHAGGDFILRIEDTDRKREVKGAVGSIKSTLTMFNLQWDEFYVQSERQEFYKKSAEKLVADGHAFYCQCSAKNAKEQGYSRTLKDPCRDKSLDSGAIKLKVPEGKTVSYTDFVHKKEISWKTDDVYDATLLKSDGFPTYHLAAMADDLDMKVTHILRGHDWLPSTPIHLLVFEYLGGERPAIGHLTDILSSETGKKLSKRRDSVFAEQFIEEGYLPEALLNFVMLLGWAPKDDREFYTLDEFVKNFDIEGFQDANPKFLQAKLDWFNQQYIMKKTDSELQSILYKFESEKNDNKLWKQITPLVKTRIKTLKEFDDLAGFFFSQPQVDSTLLGDKSPVHLTKAIETLEKIKEWKLDNINKELMALVKKEDFKTGEFFMDMRIAITGKKFTPPINESMEILGKKETLTRLKRIKDN